MRIKLTNYEALKQWTQEHGHFPNRAKIEGRGLLNWYKYNAKLIKQGKLSPEREQKIQGTDGDEEWGAYGWKEAKGVRKLGNKKLRKLGIYPRKLGV